MAMGPAACLMKSSKKRLFAQIACCRRPIFLLTSAVFAGACGPVEKSVDLIIRDVSVYSGDRQGPFMANIAISDGKFVAVDESRRRSFKARDAIDGRSLYMVPGLWEMHAHIADAESESLDPGAFLRFGITGIRDAGGYSSVIESLRNSRTGSSGAMPVIYSVGPILNGEEFAPFHLAVTSREEATAAVEDLVNRGYRQIKIHRALSREAYVSILEIAHRLGATVVGHIPLGIRPLEACELGQDGIEHLGSLLESYVSTAEGNEKNIHAAIKHLLSDDAEPLFHCLRERSVFVTPTLVVYPAVARSRGFEEIPQELRDQISAFQRIVLRLHESGVPLLVGTDTASVGPLKISPGSAYHEEMALLQEAGIPPADIMRMATLNAARALGTETTRGTIEPGKYADFVLTPLDPGSDIRQLAEVQFVYANGVEIKAVDQRAEESVEQP